MAWEYAENIENDLSFAHAKYGGNPKKNICFVTKSLFGKKLKSSFGALGLENPHGEAIMSEATQKGNWPCIPEQVTAASR